MNKETPINSEFPQHKDVLPFSMTKAIENEEKGEITFSLFRALIIHGRINQSFLKYKPAAATGALLKDLKFDGSVIQIIEQKNETPDGKGYPAGLTAGSIMQEAKIISVANAFVAMSSARAYRPGLPVNKVIDTLLEQADSAFDRKVIAALFHIAENGRTGRTGKSFKCHRKHVPRACYSCICCIAAAGLFSRANIKAGSPAI
jgi:hypothetical protein